MLASLLRDIYSCAPVQNIHVTGRLVFKHQMCKTVRQGKYQTGALLQSRLELATKLREDFTIMCWVRHPSGFSVDVDIKASAKNITMLRFAASSSQDQPNIAINCSEI